MLEKFTQILEDKLKSLTEDFNGKSDNLNKVISDMGKYSSAKEVIQNDLHAINGAIQAYRSTIDLLKGNTDTPTPVTGAPE